MQNMSDSADNVPIDSGRKIEILVKDLKSLTSVNLPYYTTSCDKSYDLLGGKESLHQSLSKSNAIQSNFPNTDVLRSGLTGTIETVERNQDIVIKLRRRKMKGSTASPYDVEVVEVVGKVDNRYVFGLADCQFLPSSSSKTYDTNKEKIATASGNDVLELTPAVFASYHPKKQQKHHPFTDYLSVLKQQQRDEKNSSNIDDNGDPTRLVTGGTLAHELGADGRKIRLRKPVLYEDVEVTLRKVLEIRPLVTKKYLQDFKYFRRIHHPLNIILPQITSALKSGIYRSCSQKHGFNPYEDPALCVFQVIRVKIPEDKFKLIVEKLSDHLKGVDLTHKLIDLNKMIIAVNDVEYEDTIWKLAGMNIELLLYRIRITHQFFSAQICDLMDDDVYNFISTNMRRLTDIDTNTTSSFPKSDLEKLKAKLVDVLMLKVDGFIASYVVPTGASSALTFAQEDDIDLLAPDCCYNVWQRKYLEIGLRTTTTAEHAAKKTERSTYAKSSAGKRNSSRNNNNSDSNRASTTNNYNNSSTQKSFENVIADEITSAQAFDLDFHEDDRYDYDTSDSEY